MERELKFRAWDKKVMHSWETINSKWDIKEIVGAILEQREPYTLMQYTGIDDINGKEIYEGDILRLLGREWQRPDVNPIIEVGFKDAMFTIFKDAPMRTQINFEKPNVEVIGNIYENKELLT